MRSGALAKGRKEIVQRSALCRGKGIHEEKPLRKGGLNLEGPEKWGVWWDGEAALIKREAQ